MTQIVEHWLDDDFHIQSIDGRMRFEVRRSTEKGPWESMNRDVSAYGLDFAILCERLVKALEASAEREYDLSNLLTSAKGSSR